MKIDFRDGYDRLLAMDKPIVSKLLRHISLRQLQVFESLARNRNFTRAAEELFLAQPTVSMQIKKLTEDVGTPLFEQIGKTVHLTEAGQALSDAAREVFDVFARYDTKIADLKGLKRGHIKLAVVTTAKYFAPILLGSFCEKYPGIDVSLKVTNRERLLERMDSNLDDFYVIGEPPRTNNAVFEPFLPNPLVVVAWPEHALARVKSVALDQLAGEHFIFREPGSGTRSAILQHMANRSVEPNIRMELGSNEAIKQAVMAKLGISILSRHAVGEEIRSRRLAVLNVQGFPIAWDWYLGYSSRRKLSVLGQVFLEFLRDDGRRIAMEVSG